MKIKYTDNGVTILKNYATNLTIFLTLLTFLWYFPILIAFLKSSNDNIFFLISLVIIGPFLIYGTLIKWLNRTCLFANNEVITITFRPIPYPFFKDKIIRIDKLEKLYTKEEIKYHEDRKTNIIQSYSLRVLMKNGTDKKLLNFPFRGDAILIKQTLERNLDLQVKQEFD